MNFHNGELALTDRRAPLDYAHAMIRIEVKVKPQARTSELVEPAQGATLWQAKLKSPPVDGKANAELIALVAKHFRCPRSAVSIKLGARGRNKWVDIDLP